MLTYWQYAQTVDALINNEKFGVKRVATYYHVLYISGMSKYTMQKYRLQKQIFRIFQQFKNKSRIDLHNFSQLDIWKEIARKRF